MKKYAQTGTQNDAAVSNLVGKGDLGNLVPDLKESLQETEETLKDNNSPQEIKDKYQNPESQQNFANYEKVALLQKVYNKFWKQDPQVYHAVIDSMRRANQITPADFKSFNDMMTANIENPELSTVNSVEVQTAAQSLYSELEPKFLSIQKQLHNKIKNSLTNPVNYTGVVAFNLHRTKLAQMSDPSLGMEAPPVGIEDPLGMGGQPEPQQATILPVEDIGDFIHKMTQIILSGDEDGFVNAQNEITSTITDKHDQLAAQEAFTQLSRYLGQEDKEDGPVADILSEIYRNYLPDAVPNNVEQGMSNINPTPEPMPSTDTPVLAKTYNLSQHMYKEARATNDGYVMYGPTEKRICPKLLNRGMGAVVSEETCRFYCPDGLAIDDNKMICGEAVWRANIMDKFSRDYVDENGKVTGGYIERRFEVNHNVPEENKMRLKPGELRKPRPAEQGNLEARMQAMRQKEGKKRGYKPDTNTGDVFDWAKDVDQNNVEQTQSERDRREKAMGHELVEYSKRDKSENNPKLNKSAKSFNLSRTKTASKNEKGTRKTTLPNGQDVLVSYDIEKDFQGENVEITSIKDASNVEIPVSPEVENVLKEEILESHEYNEPEMYDLEEERKEQEFNRWKNRDIDFASSKTEVKTAQVENVPSMNSSPYQSDMGNTNDPLNEVNDQAVDSPRPEDVVCQNKQGPFFLYKDNVPVANDVESLKMYLNQNSFPDVWWLNESGGQPVLITDEIHNGFKMNQASVRKFNLSKIAQKKN